MEIKEVIETIVDSYGYHEPTEHVVMRCESIIQKRYFNKEHIILKAFEAAAEDKIGVELKTKFSVKEIFRVMKAYEGNKQKTYAPEQEKLPTPTELELIEKEYIKSLIREFNKFKAGTPYSLSPGYTYHWLEQKGLIEMGFDKTNWVKQRAMETSMAQVKGKLGSFNDKNLLAEFEKGTLEGNALAIWQTKCQEVALHKFFQNMVEQNIDFEQNLNRLAK